MTQSHPSLPPHLLGTPSSHPHPTTSSNRQLLIQQNPTTALSSSWITHMGCNPRAPNSTFSTHRSSKTLISFVALVPAYAPLYPRKLPLSHRYHALQARLRGCRLVMQAARVGKALWRRGWGNRREHWWGILDTWVLFAKLVFRCVQLDCLLWTGAEEDCARFIFARLGLNEAEFWWLRLMLSICLLEWSPNAHFSHQQWFLHNLKVWKVEGIKNSVSLMFT